MEINLGGVPYVVTEQDGQVIFEEQSGFYGVNSRFGMEWRGQDWYLIDIDYNMSGIFLQHIVRASKWLEDHYAITMHDGVGTVRLKEMQH